MMQTGAEDLIVHLKDMLLELNANPYPEVACPHNVPRRASVALILRVQPDYTHWPGHDETKGRTPSPVHRRRSSVASNPTSTSTPGHKLSFKATLDAFFEQDWVQHGDPELLFIKRAARVGDKWNGHVALPGGKRDPEDADDQATAVREAVEEVGIDLSYPRAVLVGNLPQRIVTTSWGKVPLMVLCPYVYLLTSPNPPAQRLQPTEVASTHWVSLRALQSPQLRTHEYTDVSARLAKSELGIKRWFLQAMLSKMMFAAVRLVPSTSTYCSSIPGFIPPNQPPPITSIAKLTYLLSTISPDSNSPSTISHPPLLLWGLTLGVISDLLEHIPPHNALELWTYPTFTNYDIRFVMWALSYRFRKQKTKEMSLTTTPPSVPIIDNIVAEEAVEGVESPTMVGEEHNVDKLEYHGPGEVGIAGLGVGWNWGRTGRQKLVARGAAVNSMLDGYYPIVRRAVVITLVGRVTVVSLLVVYMWKKLWR